MFANRFTALVDACSLVGVLRRNLLLTLAEAEFFRVRWSSQILDETERAIERLLARKGTVDPASRAKRARTAIEMAFEEALVSDFDPLTAACQNLPDRKDAHVLAAALKANAAMIVTENLKDFPPAILKPFEIEAKSADLFIAGTLSLDIGRGVAAVRTMRQRFNRPNMDAEELLLKMEADGLAETVGVLRDHILSL